MDFRGERRTNATHVSTTDPEARLDKKAAGQEAKLCFVGHVLMENRHGLVVQSTVTPATGTAGREAAAALVDARPTTRQITLGGDQNDDTHEFVQDLRARQVTPPVAQHTTRQTSANDGRTTRHPGSAVSQQKRKGVEEIFGWLKTVGLLWKVKLRGVRRVGWLFTLPSPRRSTTWCEFAIWWEQRPDRQGHAVGSTTHGGPLQWMPPHHGWASTVLVSGVRVPPSPSTWVFPQPANATISIDFPLPHRHQGNGYASAVTLDLGAVPGSLPRRLAMEYFPILLSLVAVVVGVRGDTWDDKQSGLRRLTHMGWLALAIAFISSGLSFYTTAADARARMEYREATYKDIRLASDQFLSPYRALFVKYKGPRSIPASQPTDETTALQQLFVAIPASSLVSDDFVSFLGAVDVMSPSNDIRSGERLPSLDHLALRSEEASARLTQILEQGADLLPIDVRTASTKLLQSPHIRANRVRPTVLRRLSPDVVRTVLPPQGGSDKSLLDKHVEFVQLVDSLRQLAMKP